MSYPGEPKQEVSRDPSSEEFAVECREVSNWLRRRATVNDATNDGRLAAWRYTLPNSEPFTLALRHGHDDK